MIAGITAWIKSIVLVVLFASFLELLLPASSMQRFVRVIVGLLVMLTIISPVADIVQHKYFLSDVTAMDIRAPDRSKRVIQDTGKVMEQRDLLVLEVYRKDLAQQVRAVVIAMDGVADAKIAVNLKETPGGKPGAVNKIIVYIQPGSGTAKVMPVNIGPASGNGSDELSSALKERVVGTIKELYQLNDSQVEVKKMI